MSGSRIEIATEDGVAGAYVTRPESGAPAPGVLFYVDAFGLRPQTAQMADRIASWGFTVLVPHVFYRNGTADELAPRVDLRRPGAREEFIAGLRPLMQGHTAEQSDRDLAAYAQTLRKLAAPDGARWAAIGYCMGGRLALRAAAQYPDQVAAVGMFHTGGLVTDAEDSPHLRIPEVRAEVLARYADNDGSMPPGAIAAVDEAFTRAGVPHSSAVYEGAPHGYAMADTSMYDEQAAERHYEELRELLTRTLLGPVAAG